jgi:UDP-glucose 4-epimerase
MKILVVGSKGFIGSHCFEYFSTRAEVWGCDVFTDYNEIDFFLVDSFGADYHTIFQSQRFDVCVNCSGAASVPDSLKAPLRDFELNVQNVVRLLESIRIYNPSCKFISLSSAAVYGNPDKLPIAETQRLNPISPYGFHKWQAEQICSEYAKFFNLRTCSLRIFSAFGPRLKKQLLWDVFKKTRDTSRLELFGTGEESRDYIFIDDIIRAIEVIIHKAPFKSDIFNVAGGEAISTKTIASLLVDSLGWRGDIVFTGNKRPGDPDEWKADLSKMEQLGFKPSIRLEEGIKMHAAWLRSLA